MWDLLLLDCHAATMAGDGYGTIRDAAIAIADGRIAWIGAAKDRPKTEARETRSLNGAWVTPGLVDCHTHLVFAGNRAPEWEMRAKGATYEEIARAGGGILSTVRATRAATEDDLVAQSLPRARAMARQGVTTVEIKSGYGLDADSELKMLRAAAKVGEQANITVSPDVPWRAYLAAGIQREPRRLCRSDLQCDDPSHRARPAGRSGRCVLRDHRLYTGGNGARLRRRDSAWAAREAARRAAFQFAWRDPGGEIQCALRRSSRTSLRRGCRDDGEGGDGRGAVCRPRSISCARRRSRRSTRCAAPVCRSPSRPTAIPAPRRSPRR